MKEEHTLDVGIRFILAIYLLLFPLVILYTHKYAVHIFLFFLAFITGVYSFYHYSVDPHSVLNALYFTFQLYLLVVTDVFTVDGSTLQYPLVVEIARWSAALYTISTVFIAIYRMLEMSILLVIYQVFGNHTVVIGYNENSISYIEHLRSKKERVVLIGNQIPTEEIDYLEGMKVVVLNNEEKEESYIKSGLNQAKNVVLLDKLDINNLNELMDMYHYFSKHSKVNLALTIYIHLKENTSYKFFLDLESIQGETRRHFNVKVINLYERFVDNLFERYPIYTDQKMERSPHLLIVGFGPLGRHIAKKALDEAEEYKDSTLFITALDRSIEKVDRKWRRSFSTMDGQIPIHFHSFDVTVDSLKELIDDQLRAVTHIYVCLHEEHLDLWAAIELSNAFPSIPIYLEFSKGSAAEKWIDSAVSGERLIYRIGTFQGLLIEDELRELTQSL